MEAAGLYIWFRFVHAKDDYNCINDLPGTVYTYMVGVLQFCKTILYMHGGYIT